MSGLRNTSHKLLLSRSIQKIFYTSSLYRRISSHRHSVKIISMVGKPVSYATRRDGEEEQTSLLSSLTFQTILLWCSLRTLSILIFFQMFNLDIILTLERINGRFSKRKMLGNRIEQCWPRRCFLWDIVVQYFGCVYFPSRNLGQTYYYFKT